MSEEKKIFEPENGDEILRGWILHAHKGRDRHDEAARQLNKHHHRLGVPAAFLSAIVGASVFASLEARLGPWVTIGVGFLSIASSALASLQTFYNYAERTKNHRVAGARYKAIIRELEEIFSKGSMAGKDQNFGNLLDDIRNRLDALEQEAPVVPHWIYDKIERRYSQVVFTQKAADLYRSTANSGN